MPRFLRVVPETAPVPPPNLFRCTWRSASTADWAMLSGELDIAHAASLERMLRDAEAHAELVVLDLRDLEFMDCTGARVIFDSSQRLRRAGRSMVIVRGTHQVDRVFTVVGVADKLKILDLEPAEPAVQVLLKLAADPSPLRLEFPVRVRGCRQWKPPRA